MHQLQSCVTRSHLMQRCLLVFQVIRIHVDPMPKISHRDGAIEEEDWAAFAMQARKSNMQRLHDLLVAGRQVADSSVNALQSEYLQRLASGLMHVKDSIGKHRSALLPMLQK